MFERDFVTAAYLVVGRNARSLLYAAAGHPPALLSTRSTGQVEPLRENGIFLGQFVDARYSTLRRDLTGPGRVLLCTTFVVVDLT